MLKIILTVLNTILSIGIILLSCLGLLFVFKESFKLGELLLAIFLIVIALLSLIPSWKSVFKPNEPIIIWWKVLWFSPLFIVLLLVAINFFGLF